MLLPSPTGRQAKAVTMDSGRAGSHREAAREAGKEEEALPAASKGGETGELTTSFPSERKAAENNQWRKAGLPA